MVAAISERTSPLRRDVVPTAAQLPNAELVATILSLAGLVGDRTYLQGGRDEALVGQADPRRFTKVVLTDVESARSTEAELDAVGRFTLASPTGLSLEPEQTLRLSLFGPTGREDVLFRAKFPVEATSVHTFEQVLDRTLGGR